MSRSISLLPHFSSLGVCLRGRQFRWLSIVSTVNVTKTRPGIGNANDLAEFHWGTPLKAGQVRLIQLLPTSTSEPLQMRLFERKLSDNPKYFALSYAWGDRAATERVICNRHNLLVTKGLHSALSQLNADGMREPLWVDAICINQQDNAEKTAQVRSMAGIFKNASKVVIWLGEEQPGDQVSWDMLDLIIRKVLRKSGPDEKSDDDFDSLPGRLNSRWSMFGPLLDRKWFTRIWIIQELLLAKEFEIRSGSRSISWNSISQLARALHRSPNLKITLRMWGVLNDEIAHCLQRLVKWRNRGVLNLRYSLDGILQRTVHFQMTDPRDRFFALAALMGEGPTKLVDYSKDWNTVRIDIAKQLLNLGHDNHLDGESSLRGLAYCDSSRRDPNLPSWVPAWDPGPVFSEPLVRFSKKTELSRSGWLTAENVRVAP